MLEEVRIGIILSLTFMKTWNSFFIFTNIFVNSVLLILSLSQIYRNNIQNSKTVKINHKSQQTLDNLRFDLKIYAFIAFYYPLNIIKFFPIKTNKIKLLFVFIDWESKVMLNSKIESNSGSNPLFIFFSLDLSSIHHLEGF